LFLVSEIVAPVQTLAAIMGASMEELARCPGIGERKVRATRCFTLSFELHLTVVTVAEYVIILVPKPTKNAQKNHLCVALMIVL
jgi:DNA repair protein RadC